MNIDDTDDLSSSADESGEFEAELYARRSPAMLRLQNRIAEHVASPDYRPVKPKVIAKQLGLSSEETRASKKAVRFLVKEGRVSYGANHVVYPPEPKSKKKGAEAETPRKGRAAPVQEKHPSNKNLIVGIFRRVSSGAGFVRPSGTAKSEGRERDIAVPKAKTGDASDGDKVAVRLARGGKLDARGRITGEVAEILERDTHRFVGVYDEVRGSGYVTIDGRVFAEPIYVGDVTAKSARSGDKVVVEMVRFPTHAHSGEGVIVEILGPRGKPGVDTLSIIREFDLPTDFPEAVLADARRQADQFDESIGEDREDFTGETIITIDPVDARDFDDAISLKRLPNGHWLLGTHIADVSHFVPLRSKLDIEARDRATSVYLPDRVIPMLPEIISNHLASLQPQKVRYTQSCMIEFTAEGVPVHAEVNRAAIRSKRRFTYEEVDDFLADRKAWREKLEPDVWQLLSDMHELAMTLRRRRLDRGAIELTLPEIKIDLDAEGKVAGAHLVENTESHQIIEEFMLAANEAVARILAGGGFNLLRRIHEQPDLRKLQALTGFVNDLGIESESLESRFEIKRVIAAVAGTAREHAVNYAVLRSMQKAVYSPVEEGHYALNSENYCHFTSPIRRYPDLTVHRMLNALAAGKRPLDDFAEQMLLGEHCSEREQRAEKAERELTKVKLLTYLASRVGERIDGVITGVEDFGFFVQGSKLPAEGLVHVQSLADDYYHFDRNSHSLVGRRAEHSYQLGDMVQVEIVHVDADRRELDFRLVKKLGAGPPVHLPRTRAGDRRRDKRMGIGGVFEEGGERRGKKTRKGRSGRAELGPEAGRRTKKKGVKKSSRVFSEAKEFKKPGQKKKKQRPGKRERAARKQQGE